MFYILIAIVVGATVFAGGYVFGKTRSTELDRIRRKQYKEGIADLDDTNERLIEYQTQSRRYEKALREIARGTSVPEITASIALNQD